MKGGTYDKGEDSNIIISDLKSYAKNKISSIYFVINYLEFSYDRTDKHTGVLPNILNYSGKRDFIDKV